MKRREFLGFLGALPLVGMLGAKRHFDNSLPFPLPPIPQLEMRQKAVRDALDTFINAVWQNGGKISCIEVKGAKWETLLGFSDSPSGVVAQVYESDFGYIQLR